MELLQRAIRGGAGDRTLWSRVTKVVEEAPGWERRHPAGKRPDLLEETGRQDAGAPSQIAFTQENGGALLISSWLSETIERDSAQACAKATGRSSAP